jgi:drug/metabolite transporter (DMT)-like permease
LNLSREFLVSKFLPFKCNLYRYTELMWSAAVGFLFFSEIPASTTLIGAAVIIPSTLYVVWAENQKSKEQ